MQHVQASIIHTRILSVAPLMVLPLALSPLSNPSYLPRLIFLKCCVHCTQKPLEAPWWPTGWSPDLWARQLSLPAVQFPLTFWPSSCNSLFNWYSCRGLLSPLLWTSLDCPLSCYGLWLSLCPSKCYSSSFQVPVQLITDPLFPLQHSLSLSYIVFYYGCWFIQPVGCSPPHSVSSWKHSICELEWILASFITLYVNWSCWTVIDGHWVRCSWLSHSLCSTI